MIDILEAWNQSPTISLNEARKFWISRQGMSFCPGDIFEQDDRVSYLYYKLTGELLDCQVGNTMMFVLPKKYGEMAMDEDFLSCIPLVTLIRQRKTSKSFVDAGIEYFRECIGKLSELVQQNLVRVYVFHWNVELKSVKVLDSIKKLSARSYSWGDTIDRVGHDVFFKLVKACSSESDSIHYVYSVDCLMGLYGTFLM